MKCLCCFFCAAALLVGVPPMAVRCGRDSSLKQFKRHSQRWLLPLTGGALSTLQFRSPCVALKLATTYLDPIEAATLVLVRSLPVLNSATNSLTLLFRHARHGATACPLLSQVARLRAGVPNSEKHLEDQRMYMADTEVSRWHSLLLYCVLSACLACIKW